MKNSNGLKFCHWKIHFLGVQSHFSPKVLSHRIFSLPNAPFKIWAVYPCFTRWHDVSLSPSGTQAWEFSGKSRNSCFFGQNLCIFLPFRDVLGLFDKISCFFFLLKVLLMPGNKRGQKKKKKKKSELTTFRNLLQHDMTFCYPPQPLFSHTLTIDDGMIGLIDLSLFFNSLSLCQTHRRRNDLQWGGGKFFEVKNGASVPAVALARRRGVWGGMCPLRSWSFFENIGLNEAIWCTIFHHVKHSTSCLLGHFLL